MKVQFCLRKAGYRQSFYYVAMLLQGLIFYRPFTTQAQSPAIHISQPCSCKNNASNLLNGQFEETIQVAAPPDQVWQVVSATGLYRSDSPTPPAAPLPLQPGTLLTPDNGTGVYTLQAIHVDAQGYLLRVANTLGDTLAISNQCQYPNPVIEGLNTTYCLYSAPVLLIGQAGDNNLGFSGFEINGTSATLFNPQTGTGEYLITYTVDGGTAQGNDPGCIQQASQYVNVIETPQVLTCNTEVSIALDTDCNTRVLPDMILEGTYGCFDDYEVQITTVTGVSLGDSVSSTHIGIPLLVTVTHLPSGNFCTGSVVVVDNTPPALSCAPVWINCAVPDNSPAYLSGVAGIEEAYPLVTENCGQPQLTYIDKVIQVPCGENAQGMEDLSSYLERKWTATDAQGNTGACIQYVYIRRLHVDDIVLPQDTQLTCQQVSLDPSFTGLPYFVDLDTIWTVLPGSGSCDLSIQFTDDTIQYCPGSRSIVRHWTVFDWCFPDNAPGANPAYFDQTIKIKDTLAPLITCPDNFTVSTNAFECCAIVDLPDVVLEDNCSGIALFYVKIDALDAETLDTLGVYVLDAALSDFPGNNPWISDTLGTPGLTPCLPLGIHTVTYIATDACGNTRDCAFALFVEDQVPPVAVCDEFTQVALDEDGIVYIEASTFDDGSYDNCGEVFFKAKRFGMNRCQPDSLYHDEILFCCFDMKDTVSVTLRVYENPVPDGPVGPTFASGNFIDCSVKVFVDDKLKPVCTQPADVTINCDNFDPSLGLYGFAQGADNCRVDSVRVKNNFNLFDTICNKGTILRTFTVYDRAGQTSKCTQRIVVEYVQDYYLRFPDDKIINVCDGTGDYGAPVFADIDCEIPGVSYTDEIFTIVPDACFQINRTWSIINWCTYNPNLPAITVPNPNPNANGLHPSNRPGPVVAPWGTPAPWAPTVVKIFPDDPTPTNYSVFWSPDANAYFYTQIIKIIESQAPIVPDCPAGGLALCDESANSELLWNEMYWWDEKTGQHDLCEGAVDISITATDACSGSNLQIRYLLFLDLDGDANMETVVSSNNLPGPNTLYYYNAGNQDFSGGEARNFDKRNVPDNQKYAFALQTSVSGNQMTAALRWNTSAQPQSYTLPELPYGTHKIKWIVADGCGNEQVCEYEFTISDCKKPSVVCVNGLSVNLMQNGMIDLWTSDLLLYGSDNCTPENRLQYALEKSAASTGLFPLDASGQPMAGVTFTCTELGAQPVRLWARDLQGNADFCETYIIIQDNSGVCGAGAYLSVGGSLKTENNNGLEDASVSLSGSHPAFPPLNLVNISGDSGAYLFSNALPIASNYSLTPYNNDNPLNGVTTYDLVLLSKHILGAETLNSPYKRIAADINQSGTITTYDVVELRKLILGVYNTFPNNTAWRFVDKSFDFPDPENPWATVFPESKTVQQALSQQLHNNFVSIKTGDLNQTALPNDATEAPDRNRLTCFLETPDRFLHPGEIVEIPFFNTGKGISYQLTLLFEQLDLIEVQPGNALQADHFALFDGALSISCEASQKQAGIPEFTLVFHARTKAWLSELLQLSSRITLAEAYGPQGIPIDIALRFGDNHIQFPQPELFQNVPNPFVDQTDIRFFLPETSEASLRVSDISGKILWQQSGLFVRGYHRIRLTREQLQHAGALFCHLETGGRTLAIKMYNAQ